MNRKLNISGKFWLASLLVLLAIFLTLLPSANAGAMSEISGGVSTYVKPAGDCLADFYTGDVYKTVDEYCGTGPGNPQVWTPTPLSQVSSSNSSQNLVDTVRTPKPQGTPDMNPTKILPTKTVVATSTPEPTQISTETPEPEATKECRNKNQLRDGTIDCNAGGGNG